MISFLNKIKFHLKAVNQHGVHSPFVFMYLTRCLYLKPKKSTRVTEDVLLKSIAYFNSRTINIIGNEALESKVKSHFSQINFSNEKLDVLYLESISYLQNLASLEKFKLHNNSVILINGIHTNKLAKIKWEELINIAKFTVTIDFYYCGALFIRREQDKEHFKIRL